MSDGLEERLDELADVVEAQSEQIDELEAENAALRQDMQGLIQQHKQALGRITELEEQLGEVGDERERLIFRVGKLESALPDADSEYDTLSRDEKASLVTAHIMERAYASNGKAALTYNDVQWSVFDGEPSPSHCYTLMKMAAEEDGFEFKDDVRPKQLRVNLDVANAEPEFSHAKNTEQSGVR